MKNYNMKEFCDKCRIAAAEGCVLLKNDDGVLPLGGSGVSLFGRFQRDYYKSGVGSGGMVNVDYTTNIIDSLAEKKNINLNRELAEIYKNWIDRHPFTSGEDWGKMPWSQPEMPIDDELVKNARKNSEKAVVFIGRCTGEGYDFGCKKGGWYLTDIEENMLGCVRRFFDDVCVVLNIGGLMDFGWIEKYGIKSVLIIWQGGMEGGRAAADVLAGDSVPSGRLTDTVAHELSDYPGHSDFGNQERVVYNEDIYVGYRYFETFKKDSVMFPFGFGLSYTSFETEVFADCTGMTVNLKATVKNTGNYIGKETVQVYCKAPQGTLGKPERVLVSFAKTVNLNPGEQQSFDLRFDLKDIASFDDSGAIGNKGCFVLESGEYEIFAGRNVRDAEKVLSVKLPETVVTKNCGTVIPVNESFMRIVSENGKIKYEAVPENKLPVIVPKGEYELPEEIPQTGGRGIKLSDVKCGKADMKDFIAQLSDEDLCCIIRGEGATPKVTPGTGCAFGGVTGRLYKYEIPVLCGTDGPSGIRMDSGVSAVSIPAGISLASTWDTALIADLAECLGAEMTANNIDALLGPGMNIHRYPLCGRNFEYFSEDPLISGSIASAISDGIARCGHTAVIKHFAANNQEAARRTVNSVVSERALREIYLKCFEIAVKNSGVRAIMTSYNKVNGVWMSNNYYILKKILRDEWGFDGIVMTDWWALMNSNENEKGSLDDLTELIKAQNDLCMVCLSSEEKSAEIMKKLADGAVTRAELQRNAEDICRFAMNACDVSEKCRPEYFENYADKFSKSQTAAVVENPQDCCSVTVSEEGCYIYAIEVSAGGDELAQYNMTAEIGSGRVNATFKGNTDSAVICRAAWLRCGENKIRFDKAHAVRIKRIEFRKNF